MTGAQGLHERVHILAGVMPLKSHKVAPYIQKKVSGIIVPDAIVDRLRKSNDPGDEGCQICVERGQDNH